MKTHPKWNGIILPNTTRMSLILLETQTYLRTTYPKILRHIINFKSSKENAWHVIWKARLVPGRVNVIQAVSLVR